MRLQHQIFRGPLSPKIELDASDEWGRDVDARGTWTVQSGKPGKTVDYGLVSDGHGFEDSPDSERIAGGVNSKGPYAVAIGRQANMLQWGFYAAPDRMTESARQVFLNALVYMRQFDGHKPLVTRVSYSRDWMRQYIYIARKLPTLKGERRKRLSTSVRRMFSGLAPASAGVDPDKLQEWLDANIEYVYTASNRNLLVDAELAKLSISNRKPAFLAWLDETLRSNPEHALALRLAERYLPAAHAKSAEAVLAYVGKDARSRLFFSDVGGFKWLRCPPDLVRPSQRAKPVEASGHK